MGVGTSTFTVSVPLDLSGDLAVNAGTLIRGSNDITLEGSLSTGALGRWSGDATTTFDGAGLVNWSDANPSTTIQYIGNVVIDGASKFVVLTDDVGSYDVIIGADDTLSAAIYTNYVAGDWTNNGTYIAGTGRVEIVNDDRTYPPNCSGLS